MDLIPTNILSNLPCTCGGTPLSAKSEAERHKAVEQQLNLLEQLANQTQLVTVEDRQKSNEIQQAYKQELELINQQVEQLLLSASAFCADVNSRLSSIPIHPYEKMKYLYLDKDKPLKTIYDLDFPLKFCPIEATQQLSALSDKYDGVALTQLQALTSEEIEEPVLNIFATLSGNKFVIDEEKVKAHVEFQELVRTIPLEEIQTNPITVAYKLINHFIEVYK